MKVNIRLSVLAFLCSITIGLTAQTIDDAFKQAKKENKIVMIEIESSTCNECNEVAAKGLTGNLVKSNLEINCVFFKMNKLPDQLSSANSLYNLSSDFFGILFFDTDKNVLDVMNGSSTFYIPYLEHIEKALKEKQSKESNLNQLKKDYYNNVGGYDALKNLIEKIRNLNLEPQQQLVDELTQKAPEDSITSISFLQFIMKCAPLEGSAALQNILKNNDNYNIAWYKIPLQERVSINNRIYIKSIAKAISAKDPNYAYKVASARQSKFSNDFEGGLRANMEAMLQYYKGVNDTAHYLINVSGYYERFMSTKVDSIQKEDSIRREKTFKNIPPANTGNQPTIAKNGVFQSRLVSFSPRTQYFASQLNAGAWAIYTYSKDTQYFTKALSWAKRANEFYETPAIMDTYARLLYKTGNKEEAISWEQKAIDTNKIKAFSTIEFEKIISKMKEDAIKIDAY